MSEFDSGAREITGYFLPQESQLRLQKLHEYAGFLAHMAQPHTPGDEPGFLPAARLGELAVCLELLREQIARVLGELTRSAPRAAAAPVADAEPDAAPDAAPDAVQAAPGHAGSRYLFGVTLEQIDELDRLVNMIVALGDVVIASDEAEFADHTLAVLGDALFNDACEVRAILGEVSSQRLDEERDPQAGVREERAVYRVGEAGVAGYRALRGAASARESLRGGGGQARWRQASGLGFRQAVPACH